MWAVSGSSLLPGLGMPPMTSLLPNEFMASLMLKLTGGWFRCGGFFSGGAERKAGGWWTEGLPSDAGDVVGDAEGVPGDGVMP